MHYLYQKEVLGNSTIKDFPSLLLRFFAEQFLPSVWVFEYQVPYEFEAPLASSSWKEQAVQSILELVRLNARIRSLASFAACLLLL